MTARLVRMIVRPLTAVYWIVLAVLTHIPPTKIPKTNVSDKLEHMIAYGLLAALLHLCLWPLKKPPLTIAAIVLGAVLAWGVVDELTQPIFNRSCDYRDWLADASGAAIAVLVMTVVRKLNAPPAPPADQV